MSRVQKLKKSNNKSLPQSAGTSIPVPSYRCYRLVLRNLQPVSLRIRKAFVIVFGPQGNGFDTIDIGLCFLGTCVGVHSAPSLMPLSKNRTSQKTLRRQSFRSCAEGRLMMGRIAGITFPASLFWFTWTSYRSIH
jgi:hypothetical protein